MKTNSWLVGLALLFLLSPNSLKASGASDLTLPTGYKVVQVLISKDDFVSAKSAAENLAVAVQRWIDEKGTSDPQYPNVSQMRSGLDGIKLSKSDEE